MKRIYIIAEAGVNHNGNLDLAFELVDKAAKAGVDCIKFQTYRAENMVSKEAKKAGYQMNNTKNNDSQYAMLKKLELSDNEFIRIQKHCEDKKIEFLSTPFDLESINFLNNLGIPFWKVPSGEVTNLPYLVKIAETCKPVIMSTGMCTLNEIRDAFEILQSYGCPKITLLHCNTEYPTLFEDVNLRAMLTLKQQFGCEVGYSDHTNGIEVSIAASALGADIIEKHFTLDRNMEGPDHKASLEPDDLEAMVKSIRNIEVALGNGVKAPSKSEEKNKEIARKSIVAAKKILKGETLTEDNITTKRPGNGISPMRWFEVLGKLAIMDFKEDDFIIIE